MQTVYGLVGVLDADERLLRQNNGKSGKPARTKSTTEINGGPGRNDGAEMWLKWRKGLEGRMVGLGNVNRNHLDHSAEADVQNFKIHKSAPIFPEDQGADFRRRSETARVSDSEV